MFQPPYCPWRKCPAHTRPRPDDFEPWGSYRVQCRPHPIPRFRCQQCGRTFSRQTFRADYRDHRPDLNPRLFEYLASGLGIRQSARLLGLSLRCTELKFRKTGFHFHFLLVSVRNTVCCEAFPRLSL